MNENINTDQQQESTQQGATTQPEENGSIEKMFTQADVDRIIKQRLSERRTKSAEIETLEADLRKREAALDQREATVKQHEAAILRRHAAAQAGLPEALADRLTGNDEKELRTDAEKLLRAIQSIKPKRQAPPLRNPEADDRPLADFDGAFSRKIKHQPKQYGFYEED